MPTCNRCHCKLLWRQPYNKNKPFSENVNGLDGKPHRCSKEIIENIESWYRIWKAVYRFKVPIWCHSCNKSYPRDKICKHIKDDGFQEGVDTCEFYADSYKAYKNREIFKRAHQKEEEKNKYDPREQEELDMDNLS